jgi:hypothetical protein
MHLWGYVRKGWIWASLCVWYMRAGVFIWFYLLRHNFLPDWDCGHCRVLAMETLNCTTIFLKILVLLLDSNSQTSVVSCFHYRLIPVPFPYAPSEHGVNLRCPTNCFLHLQGLLLNGESNAYSFLVIIAKLSDQITVTAKYKTQHIYWYWCAFGPRKASKVEKPSSRGVSALHRWSLMLLPVLWLMPLCALCTYVCVSTILSLLS